MAAIQYINQLDDDVKVLFVTPFLTECDRIMSGCPAKKFAQPSKDGFGTKGRHLKFLLEKDRNIVCTHALFTYIDDEILELLRLSNYILILDEVLNVISPYDIYSFMPEEIPDSEKSKYIEQDFSSFISRGFVTIDDDFHVRWSDEEDTRLKCYENMQNLANRGLLYYVDNKYLFWSFPPEVFDEDIFDDVLVLTYMFKYQVQAYYYQFNEIPFTYYHVEYRNGAPKFVPTVDRGYEEEWKKNVRPLINICDNANLNDIGRPYVADNNREFYSALSMNWYITHEEEYKRIQKCIYNFLRKVPASKRMYTTFKKFDPMIKPQKVSADAFVPLNSKATNEYSNRNACAYMVNRYINPFLQHLFASKGIVVNQDHFAISEMVQWVWRSAIRNGNPIDLYIPSHRMRTLFIQWLNNEEVNYAPFQSAYF